jgi:hypothetical protein
MIWTMKIAACDVEDSNASIHFTRKHVIGMATVAHTLYMALPLSQRSMFASLVGV